jgi:FixJ family two-component response regulator
MNNPSATLFIVDDDPDVRRALDRLLQSTGYNVQTYSSSREFLAAHDPTRPGCVILDLAMPDFDGLQLQASLVASGCARPIIFLSGNGSIATSVSAMRAGAVTFLTKPIEHRLLIAAVEEGLRIDAVERANQALQQDIEKRIDSLTPRERQVFAHVVAGRLNKQIAADLGTVVKTIKVHRARVMHKMGVRSVAQLTRLAASVGIELPLREFTNNRRNSDTADDLCVLRSERIPQVGAGKALQYDVGRGSL